MNSSDIQRFCHTLQTRIKTDYPHCDMFFAFVGDDQNYKKAMDTVAHKLLLHPAGQGVINQFNASETPKFIIAQKHTLFSRVHLHGKNTACVIFINHNTSSLDIKNAILIQVYEALWMVAGIKNDPMPILNAHVFAVLYRAFDGDPDGIANHAKFSVDAIFHAPGLNIDNLMFPTVYDITRTVYEETRGHIKQKNNVLIHTCWKLASAITDNADTGIHDRWQAFIRRCRMMVKDGHSPEKILGTAIFSCKDIHLRMAAYLAIERGHIDPQTVTKFDFPNPFVDDIKQA